MRSLLERAKALISSKPAVLGALVIVPLASAAKSAEAIVTQPYSFFSGSSTLVNSGAGTDFTVGSGCSATLTSTGLSLSTNAPITVTASTYQADNATSLDLHWTGTLNPSAFPVNASAVVVNYDFIIGEFQSGGSTLSKLSWALDNDIGGIPLDVSSISGYSGGTTEIQGMLSAPVTTAALGSTWTSDLQLTWAGESGSDDFSISVPEGKSIDLSVVVPEPTSLGVLAIGAVGLLARRRRRA